MESEETHTPRYRASERNKMHNYIVFYSNFISKEAKFDTVGIRLSWRMQIAEGERKKTFQWETSPPMTTIFLTSVSLFLQTDVTQQFVQRRRRWLLLRLPEECTAYGEHHIYMQKPLPSSSMWVRRQKTGDRKWKSAHTRNRKWQVWKLPGPWGPIKSFESVDVTGATAASFLWLHSNCFLMLISPSCWKDKHSLCIQMLTDVMNLTSSHTHTHTSFLCDH